MEHKDEMAQEDDNFKFALDGELASETKHNPLMRGLYKHLILYIQEINDSHDLYNAMYTAQEVLAYTRFKSRFDETGKA